MRDFFTSGVPAAVAILALIVLVIWLVWVMHYNR
jgi:hypothetical protein